MEEEETASSRLFKRPSLRLEVLAEDGELVASVPVPEMSAFFGHRQLRSFVANVVRFAGVPEHVSQWALGVVCV